MVWKTTTSYPNAAAASAAVVHVFISIFAIAAAFAEAETVAEAAAAGEAAAMGRKAGGKNVFHGRFEPRHHFNNYSQCVVPKSL